MQLYAGLQIHRHYTGLNIIDSGINKRKLIIPTEIYLEMAIILIAST
jgi:hypothetical protein